MAYSLKGPSQPTHTVISLADVSPLRSLKTSTPSWQNMAKHNARFPTLITLMIKERGGNVYYIALSSYTVF
jgi:hypothetical protein